MSPLVENLSMLMQVCLEPSVVVGGFVVVAVIFVGGFSAGDVGFVAVGADASLLGT